MEQASNEKVLNIAFIAACFAALCWLNGRYAAVGAGDVILFTLIGLALALALLAGTAAAVRASDASLRVPGGYAWSLDVVSRGFLIVIPFTLLALLAELAFGWHAAPAFIQAAVMTSGAAVGAELGRRLGPKLKYMIAPMGVAFVFSGAWILFSYLFQKAVY